jgi:hypothetical protein
VSDSANLWFASNTDVGYPCGYPFSTGAPTSEPYSVHEPS